MLHFLVSCHIFVKHHSLIHQRRLIHHEYGTFSVRCVYLLSHCDHSGAVICVVRMLQNCAYLPRQLMATLPRTLRQVRAVDCLLSDFAFCTITFLQLTKDLEVALRELGSAKGYSYEHAQKYELVNPHV